MRSLIIGMGEIGQAVYEVIKDYDNVFKYDLSDGDLPESSNPIDILHICFPYSKDFRDEVKRYQMLLEPKHIIVYSTVPIGTCRAIHESVVHSPIEGRHPSLAESIKVAERWIGYNLGAEGKFFVDYFKMMGIDSATVAKTEATELFKLRSTAKYGINLVWAQYEAALCKAYGIDYSDLMEFDVSYNDLYERLDEPHAKRYILYPPDGRIGGHCVVPNAKLLNEQYPNELLDKIIEMEA